MPSFAAKDLLCALTLCLLAVANWTGRLAGPIDLRWDAGVYYTLGTSIYEGKGYRLLNEPGEIRAVQYPPLLPLVIALHEEITGSTDPFVAGHAMRWSWAILYALYIPGVFWLAKRYVGRGLAVAVALMTLLNPHLTFLSEVAFSELPFAVMSIVFFLAYRERGARSALAFPAAAACYLLRTAGIALLAAWVLDAVWQRRFRSAAARAALAMIPVLAWNGYIYSVQTSPDYGRPAYAYQRADYMFYNVSYGANVRLKDPFNPRAGHGTNLDIVVRLCRNFSRLTFRLGQAVSSPHIYWRLQLDRMRPWMPSLATTLAIRGTQFCLTILVLLGLYRLFRVEPAMAIYLVLSLLAIAFAPWPEQYLRYLSPMAPYLAMALVFGLGMAVRLIRPDMAARATWIVICLIVIHQAISLFDCYRVDYDEVREVTRSGQTVRFRLFYYETDRALDAAQQWLAERVGPADVIAAAMPHWMALRTGRKAIMIPFGAEPSVIEPLLAGVPVSYVVLDDFEGWGMAHFVAPAIESSSEWRKVFSLGACRVFARSRSGSAAIR